MDNSNEHQAIPEDNPGFIARRFVDSPDLIALTSIDGPIRYMNAAGKAMLGIVDWEEGMSFRKFRPGWAVAQLLDEMVATSLATGSWKGESVLCAVDGREIPVFQTINVLFDKAGKAESMLVIARESHEQGDTEKEISNHDPYYRLFFQKSAEAIYLLDVITKRVLYANPAFFIHSGYSPEDLANLYIYDFANHPRETIDRALEEIWTSKEMQIGARQWKRKDGKIIDVEVGLTLITNAGKPVYMITTRDITAERAAENNLRISEARYRLLVEHLNDGLVQVDNEGKILFVNDRLCEQIGYAKEELEGEHATRFLGEEGGVAALKRIWLQPDNLGKDSAEFEIQLHLKSDEIRWFQNSTTRIRDVHGQVIGAIGLLRDIQEQKETDRRLQYKIRELDTFVYKASHDLKAPLNSLQGLLDLAIEENSDVVMQRYLELMNKKTSKLHSVLMGLLELSLMQEGRLVGEEIALHHLCKEIFESIHLDNGILLSNEIPPTLVVHTDRKILESVLQNLIHNAVNYHHKSGEGRFVKVFASTNANDARIVVGDNGPGIDGDISDKIFDMFYRGSNDSEGTGLGLYIVKTAAEKLGGWVKLSSALGKGAQFTVCLKNLK